MKRKTIYMLVIFIVFILFCACSKNVEKSVDRDEDAVIALINSFFGEIKDTLPENRDINKIFQMIHYEDDNKQFHEIRKDSFQNKLITNYKIEEIKKLDKDFYSITIDIESREEVAENNIFYVAKVDGEWKIIFGMHNIPTNIMENLKENNVEIPTTIFPDDITPYSLKNVIF